MGIFSGKDKALIDGNFKIAEVTNNGGVNFLQARSKYGDRMATNLQTDKILNDTKIWNAFKDALNEARPFHTRTFAAFSESPLGDIKKDEGKIWISRTLDGETLRFGGFSEKELQAAKFLLDKQGTLLVIDEKYQVKDEGNNCFSVTITPELLKAVSAYYNVDYSSGWRNVEPKHGLAIGEKTSSDNPDARYHYTISNVGPVRRGDVVYCDGRRRGVDVGGGLVIRRGVITQIGPEFAELLANAEKELGTNANGPATQALFAAIRERQD